MGNTSRVLGNWLEVMGNPSPLTHNLLPAPEVRPSPLTLPAFCHFSLPFLLPLLDAASRCRLADLNLFTLQYCRKRNCRCRAEFRKFGFFLFTSHCSLITAHGGNEPCQQNLTRIRRAAGFKKGSRVTGTVDPKDRETKPRSLLRPSLRERRSPRQESGPVGP